MKKIIAPILAKSTLVVGLLGGSFVVTDHANATSCSSRASSLASSKGGSVLSVSASGSKCVVVLLIRSRKGPPKRKTFVVSK